MRTGWFLLFATVVSATIAEADTFRHRATQKVYHGYAEQTVTDGKTPVHTEEEGVLELNLAEYIISPDTKGRSNTIPVISIKDGLLYDLTTGAFEKAIVEESNKGPLLILIEIDSPGGRSDFAERICAAITNTRNCRTVAFVSGGPQNGAYSAAAAVALACNEIYMAPATSIGAATQYVRTSSGEILDMKAAYGDAVGEKFQSVWRNFLAALAQQNNRSGLVAKAMVDKDIEVLEVGRAGKTVFIEAHEKLAGDQVVRVLCKKGEVLTLPAADASACTIADGVVATREELLLRLGCSGATVVSNTTIEAAADELERAISRFNRLNSSVDLKYKELDAKVKARALTRSAAIRDFQELVKNAEYLVKLKQSYPDLPVSKESLEGFLDDVKATQEAIRAMR